MYVEPIRRFGWRAVAKRGFDLLLAVFLLIVTLPILIVSIVLIKLDSKGPLFFTQPRLGRNGVTFGVRKLRTMVVGAERMLDELRDQSEADGPLFKMRNDPVSPGSDAPSGACRSTNFPSFGSRRGGHEHGRSPAGAAGEAELGPRDAPGSGSSPGSPACGR